MVWACEKKKGTQRRNFAFKSSSWWHISVVFWIFSALGRDKGSLQKFQTNKKKEDERKPSLKSRSSLWLLPPQELDRKSSSPTSLSWGSNNICFCFSQAERIPVRRNSFPLEKKNSILTLNIAVPPADSSAWSLLPLNFQRKIFQVHFVPKGKEIFSHYFLKLWFFFFKVRKPRI